MRNDFLTPEPDRLHGLLVGNAIVLHQTQELFDTDLLVLVHLLEAMSRITDDDHAMVVEVLKSKFLWPGLIELIVVLVA